MPPHFIVGPIGFILKTKQTVILLTSSFQFVYKVLACSCKYWVYIQFYDEHSCTYRRWSVYRMINTNVTPDFGNNLIFEGGVAFWKLTLFIALSAPSVAHRGQMSYPNTIPKRIGPMMIHTCTKFDQNWMQNVEGVVF